MDFFVDGGLQQLLFDLEETQVDFIESVRDIGIRYDSIDDIYRPSLPLVTRDTANNTKQLNSDLNTDQILQESLDYLLSSTYSPDVVNEEGDTDILPNVFLLNSGLSVWEDKFLDNFIEIPELVTILPDETPLCTENCADFLRESSENLRLLPDKRQRVSARSGRDPEKFYTCHFSDCRKIYAKPAHLKAHLRRHLGDKPYICTWPQCNWKFSRSDELARHKRSHSGIKPYCCDFCSKCFARSDHLTKHRKVHERRLLAATKAGKTLNGILPSSILTVRPGRKKKNSLLD